MKMTLKNGYKEPSRGPVTWLSRPRRLDYLSLIVKLTVEGENQLLRVVLLRAVTPTSMTHDLRTLVIYNSDASNGSIEL